MNRKKNVSFMARIEILKEKKYLFSFFLLCGILVSLFLGFGIKTPYSAFAQSADGLTISVKAGFDGKFKDGQWIPLWVTLENKGTDQEGLIRIEFTDGSGGMDTTEYPIDLPSVSKKEVTVYLYPEGYSRTLQVSYISGKKTLDKVQLQLDNFAPTEIWYGILASSPSTFNVLSQLSTTNGTARTIPLNITDIPERTQILKSIDVLIVSNIDTGKLTSAQKQALIEWTAGGGRLVLTGGVDWQETAAGFMDTQLLPLLPVNLEEVKDLENLFRFSHSSEKLPDTELGMAVATGNLVDEAQILAEAENATPLILRKKYGAGEVLYLTFDPSLPNFRSWAGREDFYRSLFSSAFDKPSWLYGIRNWSQAKEAALTLPDLNLPSPLLICGFLGIYILALGPFNYFLLRSLKRSELGWVTIPVIVLSFSLLIILVGTLSRGSRVILNRLAIVQVWPDVPQARVDGVLGIYSPTRSTYQAEASTPTLLHPLPSDLGGPTKSYLIRNTGVKTSIPGLKLEVSDIEPLAFESSIPAPAIQHNLEIELGATTVRLLGSVTNTSDLTLMNTVLLYPGGYNQIGDFVPGQTLNIQQQLDKAQLAGEPNVIPYPPTTTGFYGFPAPYASPSDTSVADILGTNNFYDDRKIYRKYSLLSAITINYYGAGSSRGSGIYLAGWTDQLPVDVNISNNSPTTQDNILYIIAFRPPFKIAQGSSSNDTFTLTPGAFNWSLLESNDSSVSPYNVSIYPGTNYSFQFSPIQPIEFSKVKSLILHLEGQALGSGVTGFSVNAWDYNQNTWDELDDLRWGENDLGIPERYVGSDGTIRLKIMSGQMSGTQITRADFTLELEK
jgi:hypothetical protein